MALTRHGCQTMISVITHCRNSNCAGSPTAHGMRLLYLPSADAVRALCAHHTPWLDVPAAAAPYSVLLFKTFNLRVFIKE